MDAFDWRSFLAQAAELADRSGNEAAQRSAISRAYYCAYHCATDTCRAKSISPTRGHRIWEDLREIARLTGQRESMEVGMRGLDLKRLRIQADYHNPFNRDDRRQHLSMLAPDSIVLAHELVALIDLM